ncbi:hypothetical protein QF028_005813 [Neobacillus sp. B4I6]|jgi:hypothetical protein
MKRNHTMMQFFEWNVDPGGTHWNRWPILYNAMVTV